MTDAPETVTPKEFVEWLRDRPDTGPLIKRIDDLEAENKLLRTVISWANNSLYGSLGFFLSLHGGPPNERHLAEGVENIKRHARTETIENKRLREALEEIQGMGFDMPMTLELTEEQWARRRASLMQQIARTALGDKG